MRSLSRPERPIETRMFSSRTNWERSPNRLAAAVAERRTKGLDTIDLTESNPTRCGLSPDAATLHAALAGPLIDAYDPRPKGLPAARRAIRAYYADDGASIDEQQIVISEDVATALPRCCHALVTFL